MPPPPHRRPPSAKPVLPLAGPPLFFLAEIRYSKSPANPSSLMPKKPGRRSSTSSPCFPRCRSPSVPPWPPPSSSLRSRPPPSATASISPPSPVRDPPWQPAMESQASPLLSRATTAPPTLHRSEIHQAASIFPTASRQPALLFKSPLPISLNADHLIHYRPPRPCLLPPPLSVLVLPLPPNSHPSPTAIFFTTRHQDPPPKLTATSILLRPSPMLSPIASYPLPSPSSAHWPAARRSHTTMGADRTTHHHQGRPSSSLSFP